MKAYKEIISWCSKGILIVGFMAGNIAQAHPRSDEWFHVNPLVSHNEVVAFLDFQVHHRSTNQGVRHLIPNLWVNIRKPSLGPNDKAHAMLIEYGDSTWGGVTKQTQSRREKNLEFAEDGRFTGDLGYIDLDESHLDSAHGMSYYRSTRQEIVIWINGEIYKNPETELNLSFNFQDFYQ